MKNHSYISMQQDMPDQGQLQVTVLDSASNRPVENATVRSTINVDWPEDKSSLAPTLVNILSHIGISAKSAGTKLPICAISTIIALCLI